MIENYLYATSTRVPETQEVFEDLVEGFNCENYYFRGSEELT
jgi:hypothetical protein